MNDHDNFLSRWSRRKRENVDNSRQENSAAQSDDRAAPQPDEATDAAPKGEGGLPPAFDVASLPPIESIGAGTDISAFMQTGVPTALRHAALRRAWTADPAIRDYMGPTENFWDAAGPDGIPGFGELDPGLDVKRMVSELFGETAPDKPEAEQHDSATAPVHSGENIDTPNKRSETTDAETRQSAPQQIENGATQKRVTQEAEGEAHEAQGAREPTVRKMTHRHGGAMPE